MEIFGTSSLTTQLSCLLPVKILFGITKNIKVEERGSRFRIREESDIIDWGRTVIIHVNTMGSRYKWKFFKSKIFTFLGFLVEDFLIEKFHCNKFQIRIS